MKLLSSLAQICIVALPPVIFPVLQRRKPQRNAFHEVFDCSRKRLLPCKSKFVTEWNAVSTEMAEIKTSLDSTAVRVRCLEGKLAQLK